jgi:hypothetical protein
VPAPQVAVLPFGELYLQRVWYIGIYVPRASGGAEEGRKCVLKIQNNSVGGMHTGDVLEQV